MKTSARIILALASLIAFAGVAQAVTFTVSNATLTPTYLISNNTPDTNFIWSVAGASSTDDIVVGGSNTFKYGTFTTTDFPISNSELIDTIGYFTAIFEVSPPTPNAIFGSLTGIPAVTGTISTNKFGPLPGSADATNGAVWVDFDNSSILQSFGNGGSYGVVFNDITSITSSGTYDLTATITLLTDSLVPPLTSSPVPEPGTMMLLGAGFLGLAVYGKRRKNA